MTSHLPFLFVHGSTLVWLLPLLAAAAGSIAGVRVARALRRRDRERRLRALGSPAPLAAEPESGATVVLEARVAAGEERAKHHGAQNHFVEASSIALGGKKQHARGSFVLLAGDRAVQVDGLVDVVAGSYETRCRDRSLLDPIFGRSLSRLLFAAVVRSVRDGDEVVVRGTVRGTQPVQLSQLSLAHRGKPVVEERAIWARVWYGAVAGLATFALAGALGGGALALAKRSPGPSTAWAAAVVAAVTPFREGALEMAAVAAEAEVVASLPKSDPDPWQSAPTPVAEVPLARFVALARLRRDCDQAPRFLANIAVRYHAATAEAANLALACGRKELVGEMAKERVRRGDFDLASQMYARAAIPWAEHGFPANEVHAHLLAGQPAAAAAAAGRMAQRPSKVECARLAMGVMAGEAGSLSALEAKRGEPDCALHLALAGAPVEDRAWASASHAVFYGPYLEMEAALKRGLTLPDELFPRLAHLDNFEAGRKALTDPKGGAPGAPGLLLALLSRMREDPAHGKGARRAVRAQLHAGAAMIELSLGNYDEARRHARSSREDLTALLGGVGKADAWETVLRSKVWDATVLQATVEVLAGNADGAESMLAELPEPGELWSGEYGEFLQREHVEARDRVRGFIGLVRGQTGPFEGFVARRCERMSCTSIPRESAALIEAVRGSGAPERCEDLACLLFARRPEHRQALLAVLDTCYERSVQDEWQPVKRMLELGWCRRLALALDARDKLAILDRQMSVVRPRALDPRVEAAAIGFEMRW